MCIRDRSGIGTEGPVLNGGLHFRSKNYLTLPKGTTAERTATSSGISTVIGAIRYNTDSNKMECYVNNKWMIVSTSEAVTTSNRGLPMGGYKRPGDETVNIIQIINIATQSNALDFGDLTQTAGYTGAIGNQTRAIRVGGTAPTNPGTNTMDFVTIAVKSNAIDYGDLSGSCTNGNNINSPVRGIIQTNEAGTPNRVQFTTIPTTGNAETFGELMRLRGDGSGKSNSVRGIFCGGYSSPGLVSFMEFVTISTTGNGTVFGDLTSVTFREGGHASPVRGVVSGGMGPASPYPTLDTLQSVNFATEGDTVDFGDLSKGRYEHASISNGHGGLG